MVRLSIALVLLISAQLIGQTTQSSKAELRTYDISDLLRSTQDFPSPYNSVPYGLGNGGGGNLFDSGGERINPGLAPTAPRVFQPTDFHSNDTSIEQIIQLITDHVEPDSWRVNGGLVGSVSEMHGILIVSQTPENHRKLQEMLVLLRQAFGTPHTLCVRAYWLTLSAAEAETLLGNAQTAPVVTPIVPDGLLSANHIYAQGQTTCFSRQAVHLVSGREMTIIEALNPVVGTGSAAFEPKTARRLSGTELQIRPELTESGDSVVADVSSVVTEYDAPRPMRISELRTSATQPMLAELDRENLIKQQFKSTLRFPLGKKVLVGGMTIEPSKQNGQQLYLVLEVSELKDK